MSQREFVLHMILLKGGTTVTMVTWIVFFYHILTPRSWAFIPLPLPTIGIATVGMTALWLGYMISTWEMTK